MKDEPVPPQSATFRCLQYCTPAERALSSSALLSFPQSAPTWCVVDARVYLSPCPLDFERRSACAAAARAAHERGSAQSCVSEGVRNSGDMRHGAAAQGPASWLLRYSRVPHCESGGGKVGSASMLHSYKIQGLSSQPFVTSAVRVRGCRSKLSLRERGGRRSTHLEQQPTTWISWRENLRLAQFDLMGGRVRCAMHTMHSPLNSIATPLRRRKLSVTLLTDLGGQRELCQCPPPLP